MHDKKYNFISKLQIKRLVDGHKRLVDGHSFLFRANRPSDHRGVYFGNVKRLLSKPTILDSKIINRAELTLLYKKQNFF